MKTQEMENETVRHAVREVYGKVATGAASGCGCAPSCCGSSSAKTSGLAALADNPSAASQKLGYSEAETSTVPEGANLGLGCGNPLAIASLKSGQTVLDLGSGAGFDAFLAAKAVGSKGLVIGVDMTPEMISKARANKAKGGYNNVDFRLGEIENLPVADNSVDVIISNCVINLSPDKARVFTEAWRVLKSGGRLAISDILSLKPFPDGLRKDVELYAGCVAGASQADEVKSLLQKADFQQIEVKPKSQSRDFLREWFPGRGIEDYIVSATIEAVK